MSFGPGLITELTAVFGFMLVALQRPMQRGPDSSPFNRRKNLAEGTLSVHDALRVFSIRTLVAAKFQEDNKQLISELIRGRESNFLTTDYIF
jgi:glyceraldehyde-3-phosphate dehydrogenase (NADP+)